jgi:tetratricopeptide (TPR) repeat protein
MNGNFAHFEAFATRSAPLEWIERGEDLMKRELYERAAACFKTAGDDKGENTAYAYQHYQNARQKPLGSTEMNEELHQAANKFLDVKMNKEAAKCLRISGQLELATLIYEKGAKVL